MAQWPSPFSSHPLTATRQETNFSNSASQTGYFCFLTSKISQHQVICFYCKFGSFGNIKPFHVLVRTVFSHIHRRHISTGDTFLHFVLFNKICQFFGINWIQKRSVLLGYMIMERSRDAKIASFIKNRWRPPFHDQVPLLPPSLWSSFPNYAHHHASILLHNLHLEPIFLVLTLSSKFSGEVNLGKNPYCFTNIYLCKARCKFSVNCSEPWCKIWVMMTNIESKQSEGKKQNQSEERNGG